MVSSELYEKSRNVLLITFEGLPKNNSIYIEFGKEETEKVDEWKNTIAKLIAETSGKQNHFTYLPRKNP